VFAPLTGTLFQTASQAAMVGVGVAASMAGAAAAPVAGAAGMGVAGGMGGALGGIGKGVAGAAGGASQTIGQQAAGTMQSMGLGERLLYAAPHSLKNVAVAGSTGILTAMGASGAAKSIATVAPLSSTSTVSQGIGRVNTARQEAAQAYETSTALQDANQALGGFVFNAVTAPPPSPGAISAQAPSLIQWHAQQIQTSPSEFLARARRIHIITGQQYQALARSPAAQAGFAENYKGQLESLVEYDASGNMTPQSLGQLANLRDSFVRRNARGLRSEWQDRSG